MGIGCENSPFFGRQSLGWKYAAFLRIHARSRVNLDTKRIDSAILHGSNRFGLDIVLSLLIEVGSETTTTMMMMLPHQCCGSVQVDHQQAHSHPSLLPTHSWIRTESEKDIVEWVAAGVHRKVHHHVSVSGNVSVFQTRAELHLLEPFLLTAMLL